MPAALTYNGLPSLTDLLVVDIETVPQYAHYEEVPDAWKTLWEEKLAAKPLDTTLTPAQNYETRASIFSEFGRIVCISTGTFRQRPIGTWNLRLKSYYGGDEAEILRQFLEAVDNHSKNPQKLTFAGHNIQEFDIPYICRRSLIHDLHLPRSLQLSSGRKPWQGFNIVDTMHLWKFGDFKSFISLNLLASVLDVPTSKTDINGSQVQDVYYKENDLERIVNYCQLDVVATANLLLRFRKAPLLLPENIRSTSDVAEEEET